MSGYHCAECGLTVRVSAAGDIERSCAHTGATVIAERTAMLYGEGGAGVAAASSPADRVAAALRAFAAFFGR
jgi:hypothetical protein